MKKFRKTDGIKYAILNVMTLALRPAILAFSKFGKKYKGCATPIAPEKPGVRMSFVALADIHLTDGHWRTGKLCRAMEDIEHSKIDALLSLGDSTDHGELPHWERLKAVMSEFNTGKKIFAIGNHDIWGKDKSGKALGVEPYIRYRNEICGEGVKKTYFAVKLKGYTFICLGSESDSHYADISDEQLEWFDAKLSKATEGGRPVFVLCHQGINKTHGLPKTFGDEQYEEMTGGIGEKSDAVMAIMQKYKNVFYLSGHSHMGLQNTAPDFGTFEKHGNVFCINEPCFMFKNHDGLANSGLGLVFDVYDDCVKIRARSHIWRVWYPSYIYEVALEKR